MNEVLQGLLNPQSDTAAVFRHGDKVFHLGDRVMQTVCPPCVAMILSHSGSIESFEFAEPLFEILYL